MIITPPIIAAPLGTCANNKNAQIGTSGVSNALNNAVSAAGSRRAPSVNVTDATANSNPNASRINSSNGTTRIGALNHSANGSNTTDAPALGNATGVWGQRR